MGEGGGDVASCALRAIGAFEEQRMTAIVTASKARANLYRLIDQTAE